VPVMFLFSTRDRRAPSADRRKTLPHNRKLVRFYNFGGALPQKNIGAKTTKAKGAKISVDFIQPHILIANISGTSQDIQNRT